MNEALNELLTKLGFDRKAVWRISVIFWMAYIGSCVLAVYLSAWGMKSYIVFGLYLYMMLIALPLLFSPAFWLVAGGAFAIAGQFGREKGLSLKDAADAVKEYGKPVLNKAGYVLLVVLPIWFIAMILIDTKGIELWFLFGLPLLPTTIYLVVKEWPDGETFNAIVRTTLLGIVIGILCLGIYNTVQRAVADPAAQEMMAYVDKLEQAKKTNDLIVAKDLLGKRSRKEPLTAEEQRIWTVLQDEARAQSLRPKDLKTKVEGFIEEAKPTEKSWWKTYWPLIGAIVIALAIAYRMFGRTSSRIVVTTTGTASTVSTTAKSSKKKWLWWIGILALVGGLGYLYYTGELGYKKTFTLVASDLKCQELKGVKPGKRKFSLPREVAFEQAVLSGRIKSEDNPQWRYVKIGPGDQRPTRKDIADHLRVNDTVPGESLDVPEDGVVTICHAYPEWVRDKGIILGTTPGSDPTPIWIRIMFE